MTALDVAFAAAVASPLAALLVAAMQTRHQRRMRIYDEQKSAYVTALHHLIRQRDILVGYARERAGGAPRGAGDRGTDVPADPFYEGRALTAVMLSDDAIAAFVQAQSVLSAVFGELYEAGPDPATDWQAIADEIKPRLDAALDPLVETIRSRGHRILT